MYKEGQAVLLLLGFLIVFGWFLVAPGAQVAKSIQIIFLLPQIGIFVYLTLVK